MNDFQLFLNRNVGSVFPDFMQCFHWKPDTLRFFFYKTFLVLNILASENIHLSLQGPSVGHVQKSWPWSWDPTKSGLSTPTIYMYRI